MKYFLFTGETIEAKTHEDVTMLFSDIVGFTSICSTATPMMVINMLQNLYNQFDVFCGQLDVYKVNLCIMCGAIPERFKLVLETQVCAHSKVVII